MATAHAIKARYDERLAPLGLTLSLASLLAYVAEFGPVTQTRAAEHLDQGRASTGVQVDRLESLGLISREPDPDDRRVWNLATTPNGERVATQIRECDRQLRNELRRNIPRSDRQQLAALLVRLQQNLAAAQAGPTVSPTSTSPTSTNPPEEHPT